MTETRRLRLHCCNTDCTRIYELTFNLTPNSQPKLRVQCPYCGKNGTVTLNKYRLVTDTTMIRTDGQQQRKGAEIWNFPSTVPVEEEEE